MAQSGGVQLVPMTAGSIAARSSSTQPDTSSSACGSRAKPGSPASCSGSGQTLGLIEPARRGLQPRRAKLPDLPINVVVRADSGGIVVQRPSWRDTSMPSARNSANRCVRRAYDAGLARSGWQGVHQDCLSNCSGRRPTRPGLRDDSDASAILSARAKRSERSRSGCTRLTSALILSLDGAPRESLPPERCSRADSLDREHEPPSSVPAAEHAARDPVGVKRLRSP